MAQFQEILKRDKYLSQLTRVRDTETVRIITGVRRAGKSTLLRLYRQHLLEEGVSESEILSVNFEELDADPLRDGRTFHDYATKAITDAGVTHLFVDEVQELDDWARVINSLRVSHDVEITVTGSNASMFSGEGLTYLAGRYLTLEVLPLSLGEFRYFRGVPDSELVETSYAQWDQIGGFPARVLTEDPGVARQLNSALFDSIFTRDIALRGQLRDTEGFLRVARFILSTSGSPISVNKIVGTLKASGYPVSAPTVDNFIRMMLDAHLIFECRRFDIRGREWLRTNSKYYAVDSGLRRSLLGQRSAGAGHDLENHVYLELRRRGYEIATGVGRGGEIDFVATSTSGDHYVQVALSALDPVTLERELSSFKGLPPGAHCTLMTFDRVPLDTGDVHHMHAADFLAGRLKLAQNEE